MITVDIGKAKQSTEDLAMFLSFPYDTTVIGAVRALRERYWDSTDKTWEAPLTLLNGLVGALGEYEFEIKVSDPTLFAKQNAEMDAINKMVREFQYKTKPYNHQIDGFKYGLEHKRWLLGDEQGLGKTKEVIDIAVAKKQLSNPKELHHCLIICGVNGLKWNWQREVATHSDESAYILGQRTKRNGSITIGSNKDKLADVQRLMPAKGCIEDYFIITNVETLRDKEIVDELVKLCKNGCISMIAFDECHKCKDSTSQQGKGILKLQADTMIAMTGTPLMNSPMDLYSILKWLGYEKHTLYSFKNRYCVMGGYGGYQIVGYQNLDELQSRLDSVMLRRLKKEVLDLPEKIYIDEYVEMGKEQSIIYKEVTDDLKEHIDEVKVAPNPLAQLIRLRQATGCPSILASSIKESAKLDRMEELVEESIQNGHKVVIFSNWTQMTDIVLERLAKYYPVSITGEIGDDMRQHIVEQFQEETNCKVIVGTIGAMGTGLTLTAGTVVIFLDHPWNRALYDQAVDRCHRIGQTEPIVVYNLLAKNTIDERIWSLVNKKGAMSDALVDKMATLEYLLG